MAAVSHDAALAVTSRDDGEALGVGWEAGETLVRMIVV